MKKTLKKWMESIKTELFNPARTPETKALSVALGTFIAFSPFMGFHFIMAFTLAALCKPLDKVLLVGFTMVNNWWTMIPIYAMGLWVGGVLTGVSGFDVSGIQWEMFKLRNFFNGSVFTYIGHTMKPMLIPFIVGNMVTAILAAVVAFFVVRFLLKKKKRVVSGNEEFTLTGTNNKSTEPAA
ncbi:MAG: DUF2062 domain-containing protein [Acidobacteria bacterium]|nr:DUF2062 domain-containing protein [Acidobacteriota bacterium]